MSSKNYDRKDHLYQKAKEEGYRSRAAYKLMELDQKLSLIKRNSKVLDLGAWPGGWCQVVLEKLGPEGRLAAIDLQKIEDVVDPRFLFIEGDVADDEILKKACEFLGGPCDLVLSDMSRKLTGIREADQAAAVGVAELAAYAAKQTLKQGGDLAVKLFKGSESPKFVNSLRPVFNKVVGMELKSTRSTSNEYYVVGRGFVS